MNKFLTTLQRWGVVGLGVLGGHGASASQVYLSDEGLNQLNLDNLPNMASPLNQNVNNLYAAHRSHSSHRSHASHRSHYSGYGTSTYSAPITTPTVPTGNTGNSFNSDSSSVDSLSSTIDASSVQRRLKGNDKAMMDLVMRVQIALFTRGYDVGVIDGRLGSKTRDEIKHYQRDKQLNVTGTMTTELLISLGIQIQ